MAQNLASKFAKGTSERFAAKAKTTAIVNDDYDWDGVTTINVYSVDTTELGNYVRSGTSRYGTPNEAGTTKQTWTLARDRSFTVTIDRRNREESMNVTAPGKYLAREIKEKIVPEIDTYRIQTLVTAGEVANRDDIVADAATTSSNAYSNFLTIKGDIVDNEAGDEGLVALMTGPYYALLKQSNFVVDSDAAYRDRKSGDLGTVDGVKIVTVPSSRMPANTDLIITHPSVMVGPMVLTDYITHTNAPGINGHLIEGRVVYDAFVDTNKTDAIGIHKTA